MSNKNWLIILTVGLFQLSQAFAAKNEKVFENQMDFEQWRVGRLANYLNVAYGMQYWPTGSKMKVTTGKMAVKLAETISVNGFTQVLLQNAASFSIRSVSNNNSLCITEDSMLIDGEWQRKAECLTRICAADFTGFCGFQQVQQQQQQRQQRQQHRQQQLRQQRQEH